MNTRLGVKRLAGLVVAASITLAGFGLVNTAQAATTDATITLSADKDGGSNSTYTAYLIGAYTHKIFDDDGNLATVGLANPSGTGDNDAVKAAILTAAQGAGAPAAASANPADWVAANWLGYTTTPVSDDTTSAASPYAGYLQVFASALSVDQDFIGSGKAHSVVKTNQTVTSAAPLTFEGLQEGLYLIVETAGDNNNRSLPIIVGTQAWNDNDAKRVDFADGGVGVKPALGAAQLKNDATYVGKSIVGLDDGYSIGDLVEYEVTFAVPNLGSGKDDWATIITDTFPDGLNPPNPQDVKIYAGSDETPIQDKLKTDSISVTGNVLTITDLELLFAAKTGSGNTKWVNTTVVADTAVPVSAGTIIRIRYTAQINENAVSVFPSNPDEDVTDNTNTVTFDDPDHHSTSASEDDAIAYTFGFELEKVDADAQASKLEGAEFTVARADAPDTPLTFTETGVENGEWQYDPESTKTTVISRGSGLFTISGVEAGEYIFTETKAPAGYFAVEPFTVTITPTFALNTQTLDTLEYELGDTSDAWLRGGTLIVIGDTTSSLGNLPYTGGIGIAIFLIVGAAVTIIGVRAHRQSAKAETAAAAI
ncbi:MAG: SpaA isopeptide-forming pilin-related protein [Bifidobacterium crudilactis]|uniref:SpaA isopeptide-forming pilin-related protein n=1 Tax=Bifidobacterium crudilactis TaxID=327277 RepID=UPI003F952900